MAFHTGVADVVSHACRLLRKAAGQGAQVLVIGPSSLIGRLDAMLWTFEPEAFLPHVQIQPPPASSLMTSLSPVWLLDSAPAVHQLRPVLVNLGLDVPDAARQCDKIIEIVGSEEPQRQAGQGRWKVYKAWGVVPQHHAYGVGA